MSQWDDMLAGDAPGFMDALGAVATSFTPVGSATKDVSVLVDYDIEKHIDAAEGLSFDSIVVSMSLADATTINDDQTGAGHDTFKFSGDERTWYVRKVLSKDPGMWKLWVADSEAPFID